MAALEPEHVERAERNLRAMREDVAHTWVPRLLGDVAAHGVSLTEQEKRVLLASSYGMTEPMVADLLGIGGATVTRHLAHIRAKLGAKNTTHAVALAIRCGAIQ